MARIMATRYNPNFIDKVRILREAGVSRDDVAEMLQVTAKTLRNWAAKYPDFDAALKAGHGNVLYRKEYDDLARNFCLMGATNADLAKFLNVGDRTIDYWLARKPSFREAVNEGKMAADATAASRLFSRVLGYDHKAVHFATVQGELVEREYIKHCPPDVTACIYWLKNRQPNHWRDKREVAIEGSEDLTPWSEVTVKVDE